MHLAMLPCWGTLIKPFVPQLPSSAAVYNFSLAYGITVEQA
jgi:hypothetical protein